MSYPMPLVILPRKSTTLGGERVSRDRFVVEVQRQSLADVQSMLRGITRDQTAQQIALGNPPQLLEVDNRTGKRLADAQRKTVVVFGTMLAAAAMREVEIELAGAIARATTARSGRLGNVAASWGWLFVPKGKPPRRVTSATPPAAFGVGDYLVLLPLHVPYATVVNTLVGRSGRLNKPGRKGRAPNPKKQDKGFLFWAAQAARRRSVFQQFNVFERYSWNHPVPGEIRTRLGTGMIVIRPRVRRVKV